jgi:hypothetical protein
MPILLTLVSSFLIACVFAFFAAAMEVAQGRVEEMPSLADVIVFRVMASIGGLFLAGVWVGAFVNFLT